MSGVRTSRNFLLTLGAVGCLALPGCRSVIQPSGGSASDSVVTTTRAWFDAQEETHRRLERIIIPEVTFRPPDTILDAVDFFKKASRDYDFSDRPRAQLGVRFDLRLPTECLQPDAENGPAEKEVPEDPFAAPSSSRNIPQISALHACCISLFDALKLVCDVTGMKFMISPDGTVMIVPICGECGELVTRRFLLTMPMSDGVMAKGEQSAESDVSARLKKFFAENGVGWPEGSSLEYESWINRLRVTNLHINMCRIGEVLEKWGAIPCYVGVTVEIHAFRPHDLERLRLSGGLSLEALTDLRRKGLSKPVASASVIAQPGSESIVKCVRVVPFPEELNRKRNQGTASPNVAHLREVGLVLAVKPDVRPPIGLGNEVQVDAKWVALSRWETYPGKMPAGQKRAEISFRQPVFENKGFRQKMTVADGETVLLGSCSTPDGKWEQFGFLTAKRVDVLPQVPKREP